MTNFAKIIAIAALAGTAGSAHAAINLNSTAAYTENFNSLVGSGTAITNTTLPTGWVLTESGNGARDNEAYAVDNGGSGTGDVYSYGSANATDRALGSLRSGTLIPFYGASFTNAAATSIQSLLIGYTGEQWRVGATNRADTLAFQYSLDATSLTSGTWTTVNALSFTAAAGTVGSRDGNLAANRSVLSGTISGLDIASGSTFWVRYNDLDVAGAEDGLAVDDFNLAATFAPTAPVPEPGEWAMMIVGGGVAAAVARRRKRLAK